MDNPINYKDWEMKAFFSEVLGEGSSLSPFLYNQKMRSFMPAVTRGALHQGASVLSWLVQKMDSKGRNASTWTFEELYNRSGIHFSVTGTDITGKCLRIFNHITTPGCPVIWAVRISMSIPLVWQQVEWQHSWGRYLGEVLDGNIFVDGGLVSNFPLRFFVDYDAPDVQDVMGKQEGSTVIGLMLDEEKAVPGVVPTEANPKVVIDVLSHLPLSGMMVNLMNTVLSAGDKLYIDENEHLIVRLGVKGYDTLEMDMTDAKKVALNTASKRTALDYLTVLEKFQSGNSTIEGFKKGKEDSVRMSATSKAIVAPKKPKESKWRMLILYICGLLFANMFTAYYF